MNAFLDKYERLFSDRNDITTYFTLDPNVKIQFVDNTQTFDNMITYFNQSQSKFIGIDTERYFKSENKMNNFQTFLNFS
jgi:hypothetical protein